LGDEQKAKDGDRRLSDYLRRISRYQTSSAADPVARLEEAGGGSCPAVPRVGWRGRSAPVDLLPDSFHGEHDMANREQRGNKEKKKPKQDKNKGEKAAPSPFVQPELVRKPHKAKQQS
jgi:hypothetical protein